MYFHPDSDPCNFWFGEIIVCKYNSKLSKYK